VLKLSIFKYKQTFIDGLVLVETTSYEDERGYLFEGWNKRDFLENGLNADFVQDKVSFSKAGALRGLHYQIKNSQAKFIRVLNGEAFDVAVDLRFGSPTFGKWFGTTISDRNRLGLFIPEGFAHGFLAISESVVFLYKTSNYHYSEFERSILWCDKTLDIQWPIDSLNSELLVSSKDQNAADFSAATREIQAVNKSY